MGKKRRCKKERKTDKRLDRERGGGCHWVLYIYAGTSRRAFAVCIFLFSPSPHPHVTFFKPAKLIMFGIMPSTEDNTLKVVFPVFFAVPMTEKKGEGCLRLRGACTLSLWGLSLSLSLFLWGEVGDTHTHTFHLYDERAQNFWTFFAHSRLSVIFRFFYLSLFSPWPVKKTFEKMNIKKREKFEKQKHNE